MQTIVTVVFLLFAFLFLLAAWGVLPAGPIAHEAYFLAGVFLAWAGLSRLP